ncbi:MAG: DUF2283 domain-containing protein, partial [Snowella sp.]|nr:DUF2283 domain-containing protein [Snowella sp.]MEB3308672.1 DUF2283 domain-containing protein [Snowella sp.]
VRGLDMKKISYSKDVDALLIELSNEAIAYAENEGDVILHYSQDDKLILVEILDFRRLVSTETMSELLKT